MWAGALWALLLLLTGGAGAGAGAGGGAGCGVAELACRSGGCVRLDAWCDGAAQCSDGSDEPAGCTPCNRTYYGRVGVAYSLALREAPRVPFLCHLTFTAGGGAHGDLVQLSFEEFRVGRWAPGAGAGDGCADGYMQLAELGRPFTGGAWCGAASGAALYYSETSTVTVSLKLLRARLGEPFAFRLRYKFLAQRDAVVRFGALEAPLERGAVAPGTYCTRTYEECHRRPCRLQSPNYPGMYPRNVSCYWSVRQRAVPTCKHAMVSVRQPHAHKMQIKRSISMASLNKTGRSVRAWRECTGERDRLIVYDGASTDDPVLLEYCGGDWLPAVTARGPEMLVAFHSSPHSAPPRPAPPLAPLRGFELDVDVIFADSNSLDYVREARRCEFHVKASSSEEDGTEGAEGTEGASAGASPRGRRGVLGAPRHTLPPLTTCSWTFHGRPGDVVWIYFSSFTQYSLVEPRRTESSENEEDSRTAVTGSSTPAPSAGQGEEAGREGNGRCAVRLRLRDGGDGEGASLGEYCDTAPALCARAALANATRTPRPCAPPDGYVSSSGLLSLAVTTVPGTATHPLSFALHYEFVDARLPGEPLAGEHTRARPSQCARLLTVPGAFASPRNALWYGRGGARALRCVYRLQAPPGAGLELQLTAAGFGSTATAPAPARCSSRVDPRTGRTACVPAPRASPASNADDGMDPLDSPDVDSGTDVFDDEDEEIRVPHLRIYESPWPGFRVEVACLCESGAVPLTVAARGGGLELVLTAARLAAREDQRQLHFRGSWRALPGTPGELGERGEPVGYSQCAAARRLPPPGATLHLVYPYENEAESECGETPFLLAARGNRSVFVRVWGAELPPAPLAPLALPAPPAAPAPGGATEPPLCHTANRILIYDAYSSRLLHAICPGAAGAGGGSVHVFTPEWGGAGGASGAGVAGAAPGAALLLVWAAREPGAADLSWMEVWRQARDPRDPAGAANATAACQRACLALEACMDPELWCDGWEQCPGGADEAHGCGAGARLLAALGALGTRGAGAAGGVAGALCVLALLLLVSRRRRARKRLLAALTPRRLTEELLYDASHTSTAS